MKPQTEFMPKTYAAKNQEGGYCLFVNGNLVSANGRTLEECRLLAKKYKTEITWIWDGMSATYSKCPDEVA